MQSPVEARRPKRWVFIGPVICFATAVASADRLPPRELVSAWVAGWSGHSSFSVDWLVSQEAVDQTGSLMDSFDTRVRAMYAWPDSYSQSIRVIPMHDGRDTSRSMHFDIDRGVHPDGRRFERAASASAEKIVGEGSSLRRLVRTQAMMAPNLLALWMEGIDQNDIVVQSRPGGGADVVLAGLSFKLGLKEHPQHGVVADRLEVLSEAGTPVVWWEFDDFARVVEGAPAIARSRVEFSITPRGMYESPPSTLEDFRPIAPGATERARDARVDDHAPGTHSGSVRNSSRGNPSLTLIVVLTVLLGIGLGLFIRMRAGAR